jgi:hypothetical protein
LAIGRRTEHALDQSAARLDLAFVNKSLALGIRPVCDDIGVRRRPHVELQAPTAIPADFPARKLQRADFREMRVQPNAN